MPPPLSQFQATRFGDDEDFLKLLRTINSLGKAEPLSDKILEGAFEKNWSDLKIAVGAEVWQDSKNPIRSDRDILEELLQLARSEAKQIARTTVGSNPETKRAIVDLFVSIQRLHKDFGHSEGMEYASQGLRNLKPILEKLAYSDPELKERLGDFPEITFCI